MKVVFLLLILILLVLFAGCLDSFLAIRRAQRQNSFIQKEKLYAYGHSVDEVIDPDRFQSRGTRSAEFKIVSWVATLFHPFGLCASDTGFTGSVSQAALRPAFNPSTVTNDE